MSVTDEELEVERKAELGGGSPLWAGPGRGLVIPGYRRDHELVDPPHDWPSYRGTILRHPKRPPLAIPNTLSEVTGPMLGSERVGELDFDLTAGHAGEPQGQKIVLHGRVLDGNGSPVPDTLVEIWQANASGRYWHKVDTHPAPLDPNFTGAGRCMTDSQGRYRFITIRPGSYPWENHFNAWRPAHIHFSLFGRAFTQRLVTQMYFPDDPLFAFDPIFNSVRDPRDRERLICEFEIETTTPEWALGFKYDIVLRGRERTPFLEGHR
jgi:protocatechuate 3,4-dioxygenase, beta subunit